MFPDTLRVESFPALDSTQAEARRRIDAGEDVHGLVVRAGAQTVGKGRFDRTWESAAGGSYQTLALRDEASRFRSGRVPIAVAVGIAEAFAGRKVELQLKWPNDLYLNRGRRRSEGNSSGKLGGVLCEHLRGQLLVGVGINVNNPVAEGRAALGGWAPLEVSELVLEGIRSGLTRCLADPELPGCFTRFDLLAGRRLLVRDGEEELLGSGAGIADDGCLLLRVAGRTIKTCSGHIEEIDVPADR